MRTQQEEYTDHKVNVAECNNLETHQLRAISEWRSPITTPHRKDTLNPNNVRASWLIHGDWIQGAANYHHARATWFRRRTWNGGNCSDCHTPIRFAVALKDAQGNILVVGEDCAQRLDQGLNPAQWAELKTLRKIKVNLR